MGAGITYLGFEYLNIGLGSGNDTFTIAGTHAGETTLQTNGGSDEVNVLATGGLTNVNTGDGNDTVNVSSDAPRKQWHGRGHSRDPEHRLRDGHQHPERQ